MIDKYNNGFVRDDGFGNPERAPEWQVIDDLITKLKAELKQKVLLIAPNIKLYEKLYNTRRIYKSIK